MKIMLVSIGTRGDMEPFLAAGELLQKSGHEICALFPYQFKDLALECGFKFESLGSEFINLLKSEEGKAALGGGFGKFKKLLAYAKLAVAYRKINTQIIKWQQDSIESYQPDLILYHPKAIYPVIWSIFNKNKAIQLAPVPYVLHEVKNRPHIAFKNNYGSFINSLTYKLTRYALIKTIKSGSKKLRLKRQVSENNIKTALLNNKTAYTISPILFPKPNNWPNHIKVVGFHERNQQQSYTPSSELLSFLHQHERILLLTFGSMTNPKPKAVTELFLRILTELDIPCIINQSFGGLEEPNAESKNIFWVKSIPYDWIMPKMYAVIHHGGSGTTHSAVKYACANLIVPHIIDQFMWGDLLVKKKVSPATLPINKLNPKKLKHAISELWFNDTYKHNAELLSSKMASLKDLEATYKQFILNN